LFTLVSRLAPEFVPRYRDHCKRDQTCHGEERRVQGSEARNADGSIALLEVRGVTRRFGGVPAVDGVSLAVRPGEIVGLIGPNGAGKTTMFDLIAGDLAPDGGRILLHGREVQAAPAHRRLGNGLGRTFQIPRPFPHMTLLENLMVARQNQSGERLLANWLRPQQVAGQERETQQRAMALLSFVTLQDLAGEPARILSGGQRKLLEIARVLMAEPQIILLDEPAAGVNPSLLEVIIERLAEINRRGVTFLLIEHNMDLVSRLCGRVLVMAAGKLLCEGTPAEIAQDRRVIEAYLGGSA
jgi:branched-chain amino acid transport system ATP-binding protein